MKPTVLVADDSLTVRMDLCETLADAGFDAFQCAKASDVRQLLGDKRIDLLILDVRFPDGDGVQLLSELRSVGCTVPVMMLSSEAAVSDRVRAFDVAADEYVGKPYEMSHVLEAARRLTSGRAAPSQENEAPTILIIDDSWTYREELSAALTSAGYRAITAKDGEEGLRILAARRPAAVLVDGVLPGIDGATVVRRIRLDAATHSLPCLLLTAKQEVDAELDALESGADGFVRKDGDIDLVLAKLNALLRTAGARGPAPPGLVPIAVKRILTVDDSATFRHALAGFLVAEGYEVIQAQSGEEALALLQVQPVDCILLDLEMPGLGGRETCRLVKATPQLRSIPIVVLTGVDNRESLLDGLTVGADDFIQKSAEFEVLKARVRAQLRRRQIEEETRRVREQLLLSELRINEAIAARTLAETKAALVDQLERKNEELRRVVLVKEALAEKYQIANTELQGAYRELQSTQAQLVQTAKLASLGELVAGIAHEINNPLAFAISHLTTARRSLTAVESDPSWRLSQTIAPQWAKATARLEEMSLGLDRIRDLILRLRTFSRIDEGERKTIDLRDNIESVLTILRHRCGSYISLTMECVDVPDLDCYPSLLNQAIMNLVANAIDAVEGEGKVEVRAYMAGSNCVIAVTDDGPGVPEELRERVLEPFFTTKPVGQGTGLGLSMTYAIVKKHRGELEITDVPGGGACVAIRIPTSFQEAL